MQKYLMDGNLPLTARLFQMTTLPHFDPEAAAELVKQGAELCGKAGKRSFWDELCRSRRYAELCALAEKLQPLPGDLPLTALLLRSWAEDPSREVEAAPQAHLPVLQKILECGANAVKGVPYSSEPEDDPQEEKEAERRYSPVEIAFQLRLAPAVGILLRANPRLFEEVMELWGDIPPHADELFFREIAKLIPQPQGLEHCRFLMRMAIEAGDKGRVAFMTEEFPAVIREYKGDLMAGMLVMATASLSLKKIEHRLGQEKASNLSALLLGQISTNISPQRAQDYCEVAKILLDAGCEMYTLEGEPVLHLAAQERPYIIPTLLHYGANPAEPDARGDFADQLCTDPAIASLLRARRHEMELNRQAAPGRQHSSRI